MKVDSIIKYPILVRFCYARPGSAAYGNVRQGDVRKNNNLKEL